MQKKTRLILQAKHAMDESIHSAIEQLRMQGHSIDVRVSWESGDIETLATEATLASIDTLVAGGGDGTLNAVVAGILNSQAPTLPSVAVLPLGTANGAPAKALYQHGESPCQGKPQPCSRR